MGEVVRDFHLRDANVGSWDQGVVEGDGQGFDETTREILSRFDISNQFRGRKVKTKRLASQARSDPRTPQSTPQSFTIS